jgi:apolipoprotein N-acyltransferase
LFQEAFVTGQVRLGTETTFYNRFGDIFAKLCLAVSALFTLLIIIRKNIYKRGTYNV